LVAEAPVPANRPSGKNNDRYALASAEGVPVRLDPAPRASHLATQSAGSAEPIRPVQVKTRAAEAF